MNAFNSSGLWAYFGIAALVQTNRNIHFRIFLQNKYNIFRKVYASNVVLGTQKKRIKVGNQHKSPITSEKIINFAR
jgi:hypothetical protein